MISLYEEIKKQAADVTAELCEKAKLREGQILVVGCSSSEVCGDKIGSNSNLDVAKAVFSGIYETTKARGIYLAAQCCEHLNRAIIIEQAAVPDAEFVNVVPQPKAGGSFATTAYHTFEHPVALEEIKADAGIGASLPLRQKFDVRIISGSAVGDPHVVSKKHLIKRSLHRDY